MAGLVIGVLFTKVCLPILESAPRVLQNDNEACPAPKIFKEHCKIDWSKNAGIIHNQIRGLSPYPAAFTLYNNKIVKIYKTELTEKTASLKPGSIQAAKNELFVSCKDYMLSINELQIEGKKKLKTEEFLRGFEFPADSSFEN